MGPAGANMMEKFSLSPLDIGWQSVWRKQWWWLANFPKIINQGGRASLGQTNLIQHSNWVKFICDAKKTLYSSYHRWSEDERNKVHSESHFITETCLDPQYKNDTVS